MEMYRETFELTFECYLLLVNVGGTTSLTSYEEQFVSYRAFFMIKNEQRSVYREL